MIAIVALVPATAATPARADGDPASDVLLSQPLFLPQDANVSATEQTKLTALLAAARGSGYRLRVAVIASPGDLGSVTALWRQPQSYARFLGQELSLNHSGPLLVVMPGGYGLYRVDGADAAEQSALRALSPPGRNLGEGALDAVVRLAAASGHPLPTVATAARPTARGATGTFAWVVFVAGVVVILLAWAASLRARPPRRAWPPRRPARL